MSWPTSAALVHFRFAKERRINDPWVRTVCGAYVAVERTLELRETAISDCIACLMVKDAWLLEEKRKPLTVRRGHALWRKMSGSGIAPLRLTTAVMPRCKHCLKLIHAGEPIESLTPDCAHKSCEVAYQNRHRLAVAAEVGRAEQAKEKAAELLVQQRTRAVHRLELKAKRLESNIKRAKRRLKVAQRRREKLR